MRAHIIKIGNFKGIRIPKPILEQTGIMKDVELEVENNHIIIRPVIVAPLTTAGRDYPTRVSCEFQKKKGQIVLDQIRTIDKTGLIKKLGSINPETRLEVISVLQRLFAF